MTIAMYPGRFDPVTFGHIDILRRAAQLYETVIVAVAESRSALFTTEERVQLFAEAVADVPNAHVIANSGLTVESARDEGAIVLVKGLAQHHRLHGRDRPGVHEPQDGAGRRHGRTS